MMRALALTLLLASCSPPGPQGACVPVDVPPDGTLVGYVDHDGERWRVQIHDLAEHCDGMTTRGLFTHMVSYRPGLSQHALDVTSAHELGHVLGLHHISDRPALMTPSTNETTPQPPDLAACRGAGICPRASSPFAEVDAYAAATGRAAAVWNAVTNPDERLEFIPIPH